MSVEVRAPRHHSADLELLNLLTAPAPAKSHYRRREAPIDPLLLVAAISASPHVTRHHYHHDIAGGIAEQAFDALAPKPHVVEIAPSRSRYVSKQGPRSQRLKDTAASEREGDKENDRGLLQCSANLPPRRARAPSTVQQHLQEHTQPSIVAQVAIPTPTSFPATQPHSRSPPDPVDPITVQCMARTRIPTPYGHAFLHLYKNNKDDKEHLAIVADHTQLTAQTSSQSPHFIRSKSLDAKWSPEETEMERLIRGAYVGRLSPSTQVPSDSPTTTSAPAVSSSNHSLPLVRIHSECFTGETIGSMRCDCGEQLDEALRLISLPASASSPGRGAVIYLRQEGRGIGLLSKIRAYNLQDMGHDTVQANLLLGHGADERRYDIAGAILKDLGLDRGLELLTNNPDKVASLEAEGIQVLRRREMVPRSWRQRTVAAAHAGTIGSEEKAIEERVAGATLIGGNTTHGPELDRYLRTKVERMGHMLELPSLEMD